MWLAILLLSIVPHDPEIIDYVDLVEVNHYYDEDGRHVFDQVIWWDWYAAESCYHVRAWRMVKQKQMLPKYDGIRYSSVFVDVDCLRDVRATIYRESWEQYDPEFVDREYLRKQHRRELKTRR